MKKVLLGVLSTAIVLSMCMATAFAAGPRGGRCFVDADRDGICDVCGAAHTHVSGRNFVDADGDGICDVCGAAHTHVSGRNFVDADGDGICDNYASGQDQGIGYGRGCQRGRGNGFRGGRGR